MFGPERQEWRFATKEAANAAKPLLKPYTQRMTVRKSLPEFRHCVCNDWSLFVVYDCFGRAVNAQTSGALTAVKALGGRLYRVKGL